MDPLGQVYQGVGGTGAAVILPQTGINPVELHMARVNQYHANKAAEEQARKDAYGSAFETLADFKIDGWYKHDQYLKEMSTGLQDFLTNSYVNNANPFDPGDKDYSFFQNAMKDLESANTYSTQIKEYVDQANTELQGATAGEYTVDSINYFNQFLEAPFEEQMRMPLPQLQKIPEATDWMGNFSSSVKPSLKFTKITEGTSGYSSKKANSQANLTLATQYVETSPDRAAILQYFNGDEQAAINYLHTNLDERASIEYVEFEAEPNVFGTGAGDANNPMGLGQNVYTVPGVFGGTYEGMYEVTGTNEYAINSKNYLNINTPEFLSVDEAAWHKGEAANINFRPEGAITYNVAASDVTLEGPGGWGSKVIKAGDIIPDELISDYQSANGVIQSREFVRGLEEYIEESTTEEVIEFDYNLHSTDPAAPNYYDPLNPPSIPTTKYIKKDRTVYVPLDYIEDDLINTVDGYSDFLLEKNGYNQYAPKSGAFNATPVSPAGTSGIW